MSDFITKTQSIQTALRGFLRDPVSFDEISKATTDAKGDKQLANIYMNEALLVLMHAPPSMKSTRVEILMSGVKAVAKELDPAGVKSMNNQALAVMGIAKNGTVAHQLGQMLVEQHGVDMEHVAQHGYASRDFSFSKAAHEDRSPILFVHDKRIFARRSGFIGGPHEFNAYITTNSAGPADQQHAASFINSAGQQYQQREYLPNQKQAAEILYEKVAAAAPVAQARPRVQTATPL